MDSNKKMSKRSFQLLLRWGASYALILLIPMITSFGYFHSASATIRREINDTNITLLNTVSNNMDRLLKDESVALEYVLSYGYFDKVRNFSVMDNLFYTNVSKLVYGLKNYSTNSLDRVSFLLYFPDKDYVVSDLAATSFDRIYQAQVSTGLTMDEWQWRSLISGTYHQQAFFSSALRFSSSENCLIYAHTYHLSGKNVNAFISIPVSQLEANCSALTEQAFVINNSSGDLLYRFGQEIEVNGLDLSESSGFTAHGTDGNTYICTYRKSQIVPWYYGIYTNENSYWFSLKYMQLLFMVCISFSLLLGLLITYFMLQRNYRPVGMILNTLGDDKIRGNEFEVLRRTYFDMHRTLSTQAEYLRGQYILAALKGRRSLLAGDQNISLCPLTPAKNYLLLGFSLADYDTCNTEYTNEAEYYNLNLFAIDNVFQEMGAFEVCYRVEDGQTLMYLLCMDDSSLNDWNERGNDVLKKICQLFTEKLSVLLIAAVSQVEHDFSGVRQLYQQVTNGIGYRRIHGGSGLIQSEDLPQNLIREERQDHWKEQLTQAVLSGNEKSAAAVVDEVFACGGDKKMTEFPVFRMNVAGLLECVLNCFHQNVSIDYPREKLLNALNAVMDSTTPETLYSAFIRFTSFICSVMQTQGSDRDDLLMNSIKAYVEQNYTDCNLNINQLAEALGQNPRHISRVFRAHVPSGLLDYINDVRVRHAFELMKKEKNISNEELASQLGFTNERTFRRVFARVTGATPGQYRTSPDAYTTITR